MPTMPSVTTMLVIQPPMTLSVIPTKLSVISVSEITPPIIHQMLLMMREDLLMQLMMTMPTERQHSNRSLILTKFQTQSIKQLLAFCHVVLTVLALVQPLGSQLVIGNVVMVKSRHAKSRLYDAMDLLLK